MNHLFRLGFQAFALALGLCCTQFAIAADWEPIPSADLQATQCPSDPNAKAEYLFIHEALNYSGRIGGLPGMNLEPGKDTNSLRTYHKRIKIYNSEDTTIGSTAVIDYEQEDRVLELDARVVKPDGTSRPYGRKDFKESIAVKSSEGKINRLSAAFSGINAGDIIEVRWTCTTSTKAGEDVSGYCQQLYPTREYTFHVGGTQDDYSVFFFNMQGAEVKKISVYEAKLIVRDLPAFREEPLSPPTRDVRGWYLIYFQPKWLRLYSTNDVWLLLSNHYQEDFKLDSKPTTPIKTKTAELIAGATTPEEKLARLHDYCRTALTNLRYFDNPDLTKTRKRIDLSESWSVSQTWKEGAGFPMHINRVFGSMARAAGFEVRYCMTASRNLTLNISEQRGWIFLRDPVVAVKFGEKWKLYSPGSYFTPAGMLPENNEFATYQLFEEDKVVRLVSEVAPAAATQISRKGRFTLDADGNLEGDVEFSFTGHKAAALRHEWHGDKAEKVDTEFREILSSGLPTAEIGDFTWSNREGINEPMKVSFHLRVAGYAELLGERLAFVAGVFTKGEKVLFTEETRTQGIFFDHTKTEVDDIEFVFPEGYVLDAPTAPANVKDPNGILNSTYSLAYKGKARTLIYKRRFTLGENGIIAYRPEAYGLIKRLQELQRRSDSHTFMCKPAPAAASAPSPAPASAPAAAH